jgi:hypothetical protein
MPTFPVVSILILSVPPVPAVAPVVKRIALTLSRLESPELKLIPKEPVLAVVRSNNATGTALLEIAAWRTAEVVVVPIPTFPATASPFVGAAVEVE